MRALVLDLRRLEELLTDRRHATEEQRVEMDREIADMLDLADAVRHLRAQTRAADWVVD